MVKLCSLTYPQEQEPEYEKYYASYPYKLHDFQKWAVEAIATRNHVLLCAPTGSGKTFGGDFALSFFHQMGKKVIYTCPIKALSNEKYYQFSNKYPHISFGLITGDIRCNPAADVLIMTTEILLNKLIALKQQSNALAPTSMTITTTNTSFEMNIPEELGCVVFDEIHMIGDEHRGTVWENTLMMLPEHVQVVGLSATLSNPNSFALWIENRYNDVKNDTQTQTQTQEQEKTQKIVYLAKKMHRAVPLTHYAFITSPAGIFKTIKEKATQQEIRAIIDKPLVIQDAKGIFNDTNFTIINKTLGIFEKSRSHAKRGHVLNQVCKHMVENDMLPALCYVFSRKQLEICAKEVGTNLLEFDSKIPYTVDRECETLLRQRLPNFEEYLRLPEYINLVALLRKGIAIHHAGLMPILKEMVELLFARGFVKLLFCTETMSVGINLPVKTTIFTDVRKFAGKGASKQHRLLHSFEMTQAAGRAGRLGIDSVGNVIHLNNLFSGVSAHDYKTMLNGTPQQLKSKFRLNYGLVLKEWFNSAGQMNELSEYANKSMTALEFQERWSACKHTLEEYKRQSMAEQGNVGVSSISNTIVEHYRLCLELLPRSVNKKRKNLVKELDALHAEYGEAELKKAINGVKASQEQDAKIYELECEINGMETYMQNEIQKVLELLKHRGFILHSQEEQDQRKQNIKCEIVQKIHELPSIVFADFFCNEGEKMTNLSAVQMAIVFSCFTSIRLSDNESLKQMSVPDGNIIGDNVSSVVAALKHLYEEYEETEAQLGIESGEEYEMHFDLMDIIEDWCNAENEEACKMVLNRIQERGIFLGEFIKALLKITSIAAELECVAGLLENMEWMAKLREIPVLLLKHVATNQSLYV